MARPRNFFGGQKKKKRGHSVSQKDREMRETKHWVGEKQDNRRSLRREDLKNEEEEGGGMMR